MTRKKEDKVRGGEGQTAVLCEKRDEAGVELGEVDEQGQTHVAQTLDGVVVLGRAQRCLERACLCRST